jgi:hypothetical protein
MAINTPTKAEIRSGEAIFEELAVLAGKMQQSVAALESALNAYGALTQDVQDAFAAVKADSQALAGILGAPEPEPEPIYRGATQLWP